MSRVVLHIDRLVLRGLTRAEAKAFRDTLGETLARQLARPGLADALRGQPHRARVRVASVSAPGGDPAALSTAVGDGLARSLSTAKGATET